MSAHRPLASDGGGGDVPAERTGRVHQIGEVAEIVQLSLRTIRYYGETGVAPPSGRSAGGYRLYTDADIDRLRWVKYMKPLDFTLEEMRELLDARDQLRHDDLADGQRAYLNQRMQMFAATVEQRCLRVREELTVAEGFAHELAEEVARHQLRE
jgi:DNA-binding transcriptional MerR regulator